LPVAFAERSFVFNGEAFGLFARRDIARVDNDGGHGRIVEEIFGERLHVAP
jgi:hypothetical protein